MESESTPEPSTSLGRYRLLAQIGRGGMADVFLAVARGPQNFNKLLVVKKMKSALSSDQDFVRMFNDEARLAARLNHPNIVQTNEAGAVGEDYYIVMEYLDGQPYHRILHRAAKAGKPLPLSMRLNVLCDALAGLHAAHELRDYDGSLLNVVHRDATPHNVFVTYDGAVKVVDFGIAKAAGRSVETRVGVIKGKVHYMAPEQALGRGIDRRVDVFAIGVILWESMTGKRYWGKVSDLDVLRKLVTGELPPPPSALAGLQTEIPPELDEICAKALAPRPDDRYATAAEMRDAIEGFLKTQTGRATQHELGAVVSSLFAEERQTMRTVVDAKLQELAQLKELGMTSSEFQMADFNASGGPMSISSPSLVESSPSVSRPALTPSKLAAEAVAPLTSSGPPPTRTSVPVTSQPPAPQLVVPAPASGGALRGVLIAATALCVGGLLAVAAMRGNDTPPPPVTATLAQDVDVNLEVAPSNGARLWIDGAPVTQPFKGKYPRGNETHIVRAAAPGYRAQTVSVMFNQDVNRLIQLERENGP